MRPIRSDEPWGSASWPVFRAGWFAAALAADPALGFMAGFPGRCDVCWFAAALAATRRSGPWASSTGNGARDSRPLCAARPPCYAGRMEREAARGRLRPIEDRRPTPLRGILALQSASGAADGRARLRESGRRPALARHLLASGSRVRHRDRTDRGTLTGGRGVTGQRLRGLRVGVRAAHALERPVRPDVEGVSMTTRRRRAGLRGRPAGRCPTTR